MKISQKMKGEAYEKSIVASHWQYAVHWDDKCNADESHR